jgi:shikimate kinase
MVKSTKNLISNWYNLTSKIIKEISDKEDLIIDSGGGAVIKEENIVNLKKKGNERSQIANLITDKLN